MLLRAALRSVSGSLVSGCPVTGSLVFRVSIGPALTLRLPFPGMVYLCVGGCVRGVGVISDWIRWLVGLSVVVGFNRGGRVLRARNVGNKVNFFLKFFIYKFITYM